MLVDHVIDSHNAGLLESVLMPFDIYNDAAQHALVVLKQRFLYDEIEAEVTKSKHYVIVKSFGLWVYSCTSYYTAVVI